MFMLFAAVPAFLVSWALGGRLEGLLERRFERVWLIWAGLGVQIVLFTPLGAGIPASSVRIAHTCSYLLIIAFLSVNRSAGLGLIALGVASNFVAITANGGLMPADPRAQAATFGIRNGLGHELNTDPTADRLLVLGDVMALPSWFPFTNAFSVGDFFLAIGLVWAVVRLTVQWSPSTLTNTSVRGDRWFLLPFLSATVGWLALTVTVSQALGDGRSVFAGVLLGIGLVPAAVRSVSLGFARWTLSAKITIAASLAIVASALLADRLGNAGALVVAAAAGLLLAASSGRISSRPGGSGPRRLRDDLDRFGAAALGLVVGAGPAPELGWALTGILGVILAVGMALWSRQLSGATHPLDEAAAPVTDPGKNGALAVAAAAFGLLGLGVLLTAGPVWAAAELNLGARSFGLLAGATALGAFCGLVASSCVSLVGSRALVGVMLLSGALSIGLLASATLAMTAVAACGVLGISMGGIVALLRTRPTSPSSRALAWTIFGSGTIMGLMVGGRGAVSAMWAICVVTGGIGAGLCATGRSERLRRERLVVA